MRVQAFPLVVFALCASTLSGSVPGEGSHAQDAKTLELLDLGAGYENRLRANSDQVSFVKVAGTPSPGLVVTIKPGTEGYPGIGIHPPHGFWNLSAFGHVAARLTNRGAQPLFISLRVDNEGNWQDNPWNTESLTLAPGASGAITTIFGYSYGHRPGFKLKPEAVVNVLLFAGKSDLVQSFRLDSVVAGGMAGEKPPTAPDDIRTRPAGGILFGVARTIDLASEVRTTNAQALVVGTGTDLSLRLTLHGRAGESSATVRPRVGRWDLSSYLEVRASVRNTGTVSVTPRARLETNGGPTEWVSAPAPLAPGAKATLVIPFSGTSPAVIGKKGTGTPATSDAVDAVVVAADSGDTDRVLTVDSIRADVPPASALPAWVGGRPPVPGNWVKTLDDEFDGTTLDSSIWDVQGENYYDKVTHWSRKDVLVGGGVVRLRYEKKPGYQNDDPKRNRTEYAAGYLQSYDKWAQRYGYFEARMKLPSAPGLWPAFWMMPDRGDRSTPQYIRQDTAKGGMEFDIMEHLDRWGPYRYNIAMHYDGYAAAHKSVGSDKIYVQPDKDGYLTCGLLWTPGLAVYYCNGREVLRWENPRISNVPSYFLFTVPSGGWDNNALDDTLLPDDFVVDYVRVWQRKDLASPTDGKKAPPD